VVSSLQLPERMRPDRCRRMGVVVGVSEIPPRATGRVRTPLPIR